jgi:outer membrane receptor protein involved in Fe transport
MTTITRRVPRGVARVGLALVTFSPSAVLAEQIEEILVTASKRGEQSLQDVPIAVQAMTSEFLEQIGAADFEDFYRFVPSLSVFDQGPGDKRYILRGVNSAGAGTVGLYVDEVVITGENAQDGGGRQPDLKLFDVDRLEVLKGPQGTTFGSSSLAGTIRYITNKPELGEFSASGKVGLRSTEHADLGTEVEAAANVAMGERAAARVAAYYLDAPGYIDNRFGDGANSEETWAGRVAFRWAPTDALNIDLMALHQDLQTDGAPYYNLVDFNGAPLPERFQADIVKAPFDDEMTAYSVTAEYTRAGGTWTAAASHFERDVTFNRDSSQVVSTILTLFGFPVPPDLDGVRSQITQPKESEYDSVELRYASTWSGPLQLLGGVFYQSQDRDFRSSILTANSDGDVDPASGLIFGPVLLDRTVETTIDETAVFGEVAWSLTDRLTLTAGLRWFDIDTEETNAVYVDAFGVPGPGVQPTNDSNDSDTIGRLNLAYELGDDVLGYVQFAQGFRSGGTNDQAAADIVGVTIPAGYGSDSLDSYEIGLKAGNLLDGRLLLNTAAYYIDWTDIQLLDQAASDTGATVPFITNGGGAEIYGLELEARMRALFGVEGLSTSLSLGYAQAELTEDITTYVPGGVFPVSGRAGDEIPYVPELSGSFGLRYEWPAFAGLTGNASFDLAYVGERNSDFEANTLFNLELDSYTLADVQLGLSGETWSAALIVNNVFNDDTVVDVYRTLPGITVEGYLINRPISVLLQFTGRFD